MKKIILVVTIVMGLNLGVFAADGKSLSTKCVVCHGANFEKQALGKSLIVKGQKNSDIEMKLTEYKEGKRNAQGMGTIMKGQMASLSKEDIKVLSTYIASLK
jgi:cytochrome c553